MNELISNNKTKLVFGSAVSVICFCLSQAYAQTNGVPVSALPPLDNPNIMTASWHQVLNNPASLYVLGPLCVLAWLIDDLPFISSRYVAHCTVIISACTYWLFAGPSSVPQSFPYPSAVLVSNGLVCGLFAYLIHRQAIARMIDFVRARNGDTKLQQTREAMGKEIEALKTMMSGYADGTSATMLASLNKIAGLLGDISDQ